MIEKQLVLLTEASGNEWMILSLVKTTRNEASE
jgi:hypothetical protein